MTHWYFWVNPTPTNFACISSTITRLEERGLLLSLAISLVNGVLDELKSLQSDAYYGKLSNVLYKNKGFEKLKKVSQIMSGDAIIDETLRDVQADVKKRLVYLRSRYPSIIALSSEFVSLVEQEIPEGCQSLSDSLAKREKVAAYCIENFAKAIVRIESTTMVIMSVFSTTNITCQRPQADITCQGLPQADITC
ncbi:uncharacterized protein LOC121855674 [Homarus americanus]|uniref:uncharacterized protein LOC121855674 n=1 Tax=Homarus americanus TaxID=6706 RepID=UPI001C438E17|nr:uncharacterized protein LOC121855674 [Homarus americanus]